MPKPEPGRQPPLVYLFLATCKAKKPLVQALILAPTRELAAQSASAITDFAKGMNLGVVAVYGGASYTPQIAALREGAQIVVGTPGRVMDLMERGELDLSALRFFVLDEADEMLNMGFREDIETNPFTDNLKSARHCFSQQQCRSQSWRLQEPTRRMPRLSRL